MHEATELFLLLDPVAEGHSSAVLQVAFVADKHEEAVGITEPDASLPVDQQVKGHPAVNLVNEDTYLHVVKVLISQVVHRIVSSCVPDVQSELGLDQLLPDIDDLFVSLNGVYWRVAVSPPG